LNFKKFEIKTIRFNTILKTITETNLIEKKWTPKTGQVIKL